MSLSQTRKGLNLQKQFVALLVPYIREIPFLGDFGNNCSPSIYIG